MAGRRPGERARRSLRAIRECTEESVGWATKARGAGGALSSPSPREERAGRGPGRGESLENIARKRSRISQAPLSLTLSPLRGEREFVSRCRPPCDLMSKPQSQQALRNVAADVRRL